MTQDEARAIHQRLDRFDDKLDQIVAAVTKQVAICVPTRVKLEAVYETVYGNGRDGLVTRVDRLETVRRLSGNVAAAIIGLLSGIVVAVVAWLLER